MCTTWTITKLAKKDCASSFLACRFPLDDDPDDDPRRYATTTPQLPMRNKVGFDYQRSSGGVERVIRNKNMSPSRHKESPNLSPRRRPNHDPKQVIETSRQVRSQNSDEVSSRRKLPHFTDKDQDYIVFCFKEDGAFEVVKNVEPEGQKCMASTSSRNSRQINRKNDGKEGKNICSDSKATAAAGSMGEVSIESSDSNQSDCSAASFAFPVLARDWLGSPVQMPKPEDLDFRKHKARCIGFQFPCCRF